MLSNRAIAVRNFSRHLHITTHNTTFRRTPQIVAVYASRHPLLLVNSKQSYFQQPKLSFYSSQREPSNENDHLEVTITGPSGPQTRSILRSYPKGKPAKLVTGLERLLSTTNPHPETSEHKFRSHNWKLAPAGDAVHLSFTLSSEARVEDVIQAIKKEADGLDHHPHIAYHHDESDGRVVLVVTCTTHVPRGLSLKDVKLAERVDATLDGFEAGRSGSVGQVEERDEAVAEKLVRENVEAAERARADPDSLCAKGSQVD